MGTYNTRCTISTMRITIFLRLSSTYQFATRSAQLLGYKNWRRLCSADVWPRMQRMFMSYSTTLEVTCLKVKEEVAQVAQKAKELKATTLSCNHGISHTTVRNLNTSCTTTTPTCCVHTLNFHYVQKGVLALANNKTVLRFGGNKHIPVYHPDVIAYDVFDKDEGLFGHTVGGLFPKKRGA